MNRDIHTLYNLKQIILQKNTEPVAHTLEFLHSLLTGLFAELRQDVDKCVRTSTVGPQH